MVVSQNNHLVLSPPYLAARLLTKILHEFAWDDMRLWMCTNVLPLFLSILFVFGPIFHIYPFIPIITPMDD